MARAGQPVAEVDVYIAAGGDCVRQIGYGKSWRPPSTGRSEFESSGTTESRAGTATTRCARRVGLSDAAITVFGDRLRRFLSNHPTLRADAAGYVVAHELGNVIQGLPRHSDFGIMKGDWSNEDCAEMMFPQLSFTPLDVELIRRGLARLAPASEIAPC